MRAANLQRLTEQLKARYPGIVIGGIGDAAHKLSVSDHNEDDTPGSKAAQSDADTKPEHRAIDAMIGPSFNVAQATALVPQLIGDAANRRRIWYVIWGSTIWSSIRDFEPAHYAGTNHGDHVHVSTHASDDENTNYWNLWGPSEGNDMDLNGKDIVPGITNGQVLKDIWEWTATARGLAPTTASGVREGDRFTDDTFQADVRDAFIAIKDRFDALTLPAGIGEAQLRAILTEAVEEVLGRVRIVRDNA